MTIKQQLKKESKILITDDLKKKTMRQFRITPNYKKRLIMPFTILVTAVMLLFLVLFIDKPKTSHYLILRINPAILIHYEENTTKEVMPLNEDAVILLNELKSLENIAIEQTITIIETKAKHLGYENKLTLTHLDKDNLELHNYEVTYQYRDELITTLKERGYNQKELKTTDEALIKLMFNTDQVHLTQLANAIHDQTSKINNLIQHSITDNQSQGEVVLDQLKKLITNIDIDDYQQIMAKYFTDEPIYEDLSEIKAQLEVLIEHYDEFIRFKNISTKRYYQSELENIISLIGTSNYDIEKIKAYELNKPTLSVSYSIYISHSREEKVVIGLIEEMTLLLNMPLRGKRTNERLNLLYQNYTTLKRGEHISAEFLNSALVTSFEILYQEQRG